jgi:hypothetical protein
MKTHQYAAGLEQLDHVPAGIFEQDLGTADETKDQR